MPKKRRNDPYRFADIIIASILGAMLGLIISLTTGELLEPIFFHGELILAFMLAGGILGIIGGKRYADWLEDILEQLREFLRWSDP
ncbi:MAG: hypothetical protein WCK86_13570 [Planctomycetia bacterium]